MLSYAAPILFGNILVSGIGAAFLFILALLGTLTLVDSGRSRQLDWDHLGKRAIEICLRLISRATDTCRSLTMKAKTLARQLKVGLARKSRSKVVALRNPYAAIDRAHTEAIGMAARALAAMPEWRAQRPKPAFGLLREPLFGGKLEDVAGLYLSPPEHALVWCGDPSPQLLAVDRARPTLAQGSGAGAIHQVDLPVSTPFSDALCDLYGSVIGSCKTGQRHTEWLKFLSQVNRQTSHNRRLHVLCDNHATNNHPVVQKWLAAHPRFHVHFAVRSGSGLKLVKRFFNGVLAEQLGFDAFHMVPDLTAAISRHVKAPMPEATPFIWVRKSQRSPAANHSRQGMQRKQPDRGAEARVSSIAEARDARRALRIKQSR
jgi:hypothetical protein